MLNWLPENISTLGVGIDHLFSLIYGITVAIFVIVNTIFVIFIVKYRRRKRSEKAYYHHGNNTLEFAWTALPFALFLFLALYSDQLWKDMRYGSHAPKPDVTVEVIAQQFMWHFRYPGSDGIFGHREAKFISPTNPFGVDPADPNGRDDYTAINQLHLPINKNVLVRLSAIDVIHSFFVPNMRIKQDAVPGQWVDVWFNGRKTGEYEIACAELCGRGHYLMRAVLTYQSQQEYDAWLDQQYASASAPSATAAVPADSATASPAIARGH
jgi:cytochrome c oxidase subunit II